MPQIPRLKARRTMKSAALLLLVTIAGCGIANASPLDISVSGTFSGSDVPYGSPSLVQPNATFVLAFTLSNVPLSGTVTGLGFDLPPINLHYLLNNMPITVTATEIRFSTLANGGLFSVTFGTGLNAQKFDFQGAQAFSGTTLVPVFSSGAYALSSWTYSDPNNYDSQTPTSSSAVIAAVPEPTVALQILGGLAAVVFRVRRKLGHAR